MKKERITLDNPLFNNATAAAEAALNALVLKMAKKNVNEGKMSLSINIEMQPTQVTDENTGVTYQAQVPEITYKATYSIKDSDSIGGKEMNEDARVLIKEYDGSWSIARDGSQESLFDE